MLYDVLCIKNTHWTTFVLFNLFPPVLLFTHVIRLRYNITRIDPLVSKRVRFATSRLCLKFLGVMMFFHFYYRLVFHFCTPIPTIMDCLHPMVHKLW